MPYSRFSSPRFLGIALCLLVTLVYGGLASLFSNREPAGDELRYLEYAVNLTKGYYVTDTQPHFINTPGYPMLLMPFANGGLKALFVARLLNVLLMAVATSLFFHLACRYLSPLLAAGITLISVFHPTLAGEIPLLMSEALSFALLAAFLSAYTRSLNVADPNPLALGATGHPGFRRIGHDTGDLRVCRYGPAWLFSSRLPAASGLASGMARHSGHLRRHTDSLYSLPLLHQSQDRENAVLDHHRAEMFHWMTSSLPGENGYWFSHDTVLERPELAAHRGLYVEVCQSKSPANEQRLMERVREQFKANPMGFVHNWLCNWPRMFFGFPPLL